MKDVYKNINITRILALQAEIENKTQKCFHEIDKELDALCVEAIDGKVKASYVINRLSKLLDNLEESKK